MFCSLLKKKFFFQKVRPTDYNPNSFWIVKVQDWPRTRPANAHCPLGAIDSSKFLDIDNLLVENSKINSAFLIICCF